MLAALPEYHAVFHGVSHNPFLMAEGVELNPGALTVYRSRKEAWAKAEPHHRARLARLADKFHAARFRQLGSNDLVEVAEAATAGRVDTLLIAADRQIPGRIDRSTGRICSGDLAHSEVDDLLDDVAEAALRAGGQVLVVPADRMPFPSAVAAIYRF
jgi:hypothetical protein